MADSGHWFGTGVTDYYNVYKAAVDAELARPAGADLAARAWRVGNRYRVSVQLTNRSGVTLSASNGATVHAIVYEDVKVGVTSRTVRDAVSASVRLPIANLAAGTVTLDTRDISPASWANVHVLVAADYRPGGASGAYDMLQAASASVSTDWLSAVNFYRGLAGLPWVTENPTWSDGGWKHSRYMVKNNVIGHSEDAALPWYTPEGNAAASNGNVAVSSSASMSQREPIDMWIEGPFHAAGILDPRLASSGFGLYNEADGGWQSGATLDVLRGRVALPAGITFPILWPGEGRTVPLSAYTGGESPDPLTSCAGYATPTGQPIIAQWSSTTVPAVTAHSLTAGGAPVAHCLFDETSYTNPDASSQSLGRSVLSSRHAIVIIPRDPMPSGTTYSVSITASGTTKSWTFTASCAVTLSSSSATPVAAGASGTIGVTAESSSCAWAAASDASGWLHPASAATRLGSGSIGYTVDRNDTGVTRIGHLTVGGVTFTVTQNPVTFHNRPGDFDGDTAADVSVYRPGTGQWYVLTSSSGFTTGPSPVVFGQAGDVPLLGDFDGDGKRDKAVYRPAAGTWFWLKSSMNDTQYDSKGWGIQAQGDTPVSGDFDGDGQTDPAVYRPGPGTWFVLRSSSGYTDYLAIGWGQPSDIPVPADYDGDTKTDIAIYRPGTGQWYVLTSSSGFTTGPTPRVFGQTGDVPVRGDFDGDGKADYAVYRSSTGTWFWMKSSTSNTQYDYKGWGVEAQGDVPVPGDYDGDGITDPTVYRPGPGTWFVLKSSSNYTQYASYGWGQPTDTPLGGRQ